MNALPLSTLNEIVLDRSFRDDACDFFSGRRSGHMSKWLYSSQLYPGDKACGSDMWRKVVREAKLGSDYYVFNEEQAVISQNAHKIASLISGSSSLVDLGPGSEDAVLNKIVPILEASQGQIKEYIGLDVNPETIDVSRKIISSRYPQVKFTGLNRDFILDSVSYNTNTDNVVCAIFGLTLFNMTIDPRATGLPHMLLNSYLGRVRSHYGEKKGYLLITQDINQDVSSLRAAYFAIKDYFMPLLYRIPRDLPVKGDFDPEAFELEMDFFKETKAFSMCFVAKRDMSFEIGQEKFHTKKSERYYFHNAYKFDTKTFLTAADLCGFQNVESIFEKNGRSVLHILKTA